MRLNLVTGVATGLTRHHLVLCVLSNLWQNLIEIPSQMFVGGLLKSLERCILYRHNNYHDPMHSLFVVNF
jgi:hypothetical protein